MPYKDPEKERQYRRQRYLAHREETLALDKRRNQELRALILLHYSDGILRCLHCKTTDIEVLCIDHTNNDGEKHRKTVESGSKLYCWLKRNDFPEGFQVLCHNCNFKKRLRHKENKEEPCLGESD